VSDLGDVGKCLAVANVVQFANNSFHKNNPDAPLNIHATSSASSGQAYLLQKSAIIDQVGIASNGEIYFYDVDDGTYTIATSGTGEYWTVVVSVPTTTGSFTTAAIGSSQSVAASDVSGLTVNQYIQITDGTNILNGQITVISSLTLTVVTKSLIAGGSGVTMASAAKILYGVSVSQNFASNRASAYAFA